MKLHKQILLILAWFLCNGNVFATHVAVLETFADESLKESISYSDKIYLTNVFREEAIKVLAAEQNYTIMTIATNQGLLSQILITLTTAAPLYQRTNATQD